MARPAESLRRPQRTGITETYGRSARAATRHGPALVTVRGRRRTRLRGRVGPGHHPGRWAEWVLASRRRADVSHRDGPTRPPTHTQEDTHMTVKIVAANEQASPAGKLADAEVHFVEGVLDGLKLVGFAVWERRSPVGTPQRDVPGKDVLGQRGTSQLRAAAPNWRPGCPGHAARRHPVGLYRTRGAERPG